MEQTVAITIFKQMLMVTLQVALPMLLAGLIIGVIVSVFQAVTAIREMTLTFVPKILAVGAALFFTLPWILSKLQSFTAGIFAEIEHFIP